MKFVKNIGKNKLTLEVGATWPGPDALLKQEVLWMTDNKKDEVFYIELTNEWIPDLVKELMRIYEYNIKIEAEYDEICKQEYKDEKASGDIF